MQQTVCSGCGDSPLTFCFPQFSPRSPLKLLSPGCTLTSSISSPLLAKSRKTLFPLYERPVGLRRPPACRVQRCLFLGQERLFVSVGSVARGLFFFPLCLKRRSRHAQKSLLLHVFSKKGGTSIKAGSLGVLTAVGHCDLVDLMCASCLSKRGEEVERECAQGLSTGAIKLEVRRDECVTLV